MQLSSLSHCACNNIIREDIGVSLWLVYMQTFSRSMLHVEQRLSGCDKNTRQQILYELLKRREQDDTFDE